jgi:hypothetical protein
MYGYAGTQYIRNEVQYPYFDFPCESVDVLHNTHNPETGLIEIVVNPGIT